MDSITFKLENFEGPLDLLLHLIEKHKIDIYNIPIAELTDSYLEYLSLLKEINLDNLSEFILMASTLLEIKSKVLLPAKETDDEEEGEDPREELVRRLLEYKQYKEAAEDLDLRQQERLYPVFKEPDNAIKEEILGREEEKDISDILNGVDGDMLYRAFLDVMRRRELKVDQVRSGFDSVVKDPFTLEDKQEHIKNCLNVKESIEFSELFGKNYTKSEMITTFLALLELIRENYVETVQEDIFGKIYITRKTASEAVSQREE
ncbi:MAG: segregation/condensation protein A [Clostridiales bacterium]|nr:segregation/condensation protein A [Clostridiales bacterium]